MLPLLIFWCCVFAVFHSYVLYPLLLTAFATGKKGNMQVYPIDDEDLPRLFVVFSAFNEEKVIRAKLESIFNSTYPLDRLMVFVGSDDSSDRTNEIIEEFVERYPRLMFFHFKERSGKAGVLNKLVKEIESHGMNKSEDVLVFTDANVMFTPDTLYQLAKHFRNDTIAQVAANILNKGISPSGISFQEKSYIQRENNIKYLEGLNWGSMIGAFGACYAMRADCWIPIPANYLMEDFFLSMHVLENRKEAIMELKAICYEDVSDEMSQEFKRKSRIQAGNFQNLSVYWKLLFRFDAVAFCFLSHKVIRWLGPAFIFGTYTTNLFLLAHPFYQFTFLLQNLLLLSPLLDAALSKINVNLPLLRFASYFIMMNIALLKGFWMYVTGVKTSVWSPTKRNL